MHNVTREELIAQYESNGEPVPAMVSDAAPETEFVWGFSGRHRATVPLMLAEEYEKDLPIKTFDGIASGPMLPEELEEP